MTTRRRKAPTRSVAIRRVKSIAKPKKRKTQKRKSQNIVMRGGASKLLLYYNPSVKPPKCFIIKEEKRVGKDNLYLFFDAEITSDEIKKYLCSAMGLDTAVTFDPEFKPQKNDQYKSNDLFIKLSGMISYSTIESGYLQRDKSVENKALVTTTKHKITLGLTSASEIKSWEVVVNNLTFEEYTDSFNYGEVTSSVAESGYNNIVDKFKKDEEKKQSKVIADCKEKREVSMINGELIVIYKMIKTISDWSSIIKKELQTMRGSNIDKETAINSIESLLRDNEIDYDLYVGKLKEKYDVIKRRIIINGITKECDKELKSYLRLTGLKTIKEMVNEAYDGNSSLSHP